MNQEIKLTPLEKRKQTTLKRYGVENVASIPEILNRRIESNLKKYGVENVMQIKEVFDKNMSSAFRIKEYKTPTGNIIHHQGYEDVVLRFLIESYGLQESHISTGRSHIPVIFYTNPISNKKSRHYPDIWIPSKNLFIEIKSEYTFSINTSVVLEKKAACISQGFNYIILICSKTKILEML